MSLKVGFEVLIGPSRIPWTGQASLYSPAKLCSRYTKPNNSTFQQRCDFSSGSFSAARQALGRITPKRIAVQLPPGSGGGALPRASIWRPIVFCAALGGGGYILAASYTNSETQKWADRLGGSSLWRRGQTPPSDGEMARAQQLAGAKEAQETVNNLPKTLSFLPTVIVVPIIRTYVLWKEYLLNTPAAQTAPAGIIIGMGGVFLLWKVRRLEPWMRKWWLHRPVVFGGVRNEWQSCVTLFTSVLSHQSLPHLAFNSFALYSFGAAAYAYLGTPLPNTPALPASTQTPHFLAFLLAAGLFSSLSSHLYTNIIKLPRLLSTLLSPARLSSPQALAAHQAILPSLGASGAIYAALTLTACAFPDSNVGIIFIPFISFPIGLGVAAIVTADLIGLIRGWRMFDHVAHLAGAAFGVVYYQYGRQAWNWLRRQFGAQERNVSYF